MVESVFDTFGKELKEGDQVDFYMTVPNAVMCAVCWVGYGAYIHESTGEDKWGWHLTDEYGNAFSLDYCLKFGQMEKVEEGT